MYKSKRQSYNQETDYKENLVITTTEVITNHTLNDKSVHELDYRIQIEDGN